MAVINNLNSEELSLYRDIGEYTAFEYEGATYLKLYDADNDCFRNWEVALAGKLTDAIPLNAEVKVIQRSVTTTVG